MVFFDRLLSQFIAYNWEILCIISAICFMLPMFVSSFVLFVKHFDDLICLFSSNFKFDKLLFFRGVILFQLVTFTKSNVTHPEMHINKV